MLLLTIGLGACSQKQAETKTEEHHEEEGTVELTTQQLKSAGIAFGKVEDKNLNAVIKVNGMLDVPPQQLVTVSAVMGGFVKSTKLLQGMKVKKGEVIATIQNPDFIQIQQDYLDNLSKLKFAELELKREQELAKENYTAQKTLQQVTADFNSLKAVNSALLEKLDILNIDPAVVEKGTIKSTVNILSPINGNVTEVNINIGKYVNAMDMICEIVDADHLHAELTVFEKDLPKIKVGQTVRFHLANENKERSAKVYLINRKIAIDRTVRVHAHLDKEDATLVPNTYLKAAIEVTDNKVSCLPDEAIVSAGDKQYIFIKDDGHEEGHKEAHEEKEEKAEMTEKETHAHGEEIAFKAIEIKKGVSNNGFTEVFLPEDFEKDHAEVVVKGAYDLLAKMNNSESEGHAH